MNLVFTNVTIGLVADVEIGHVPLVPFAQFGVHLVVKVLGPHDQILSVCGWLVLGSTLGTTDELTQIDHEIPTLVVQSKVMHETPVCWTVEHLCYSSLVFSLLNFGDGDVAGGLAGVSTSCYCCTR